MSGETVLYYSANCGNCGKFIEKLRKYPNIMERISAVDYERRRREFPPQVRVVPAIKAPTKRGAVLYSGQDAFDWLAAQIDALAGGQGGSGGLSEFDPMSMGTAWGGGFVSTDFNGDIFSGTAEGSGFASIMGDTSSNLGHQYDEKEFDAGSSRGGGDGMSDEFKRKMDEMQRRRQADVNIPPPRQGAGSAPGIQTMSADDLRGGSIDARSIQRDRDAGIQIERRQIQGQFGMSTQAPMSQAEMERRMRELRQ